MFKRLTYLFWRPQSAFRDLPVKQAIWFTVIAAILGIFFVSYARSNFVRPEIFFRNFEKEVYEMESSAAYAPAYPDKGVPEIMPGRGGYPEQEYGPGPGMGVPLLAVIFQAGSKLLQFAAGWMLISALFYWAAIRFGGTGTFGQSAAVVGLSWFPLFLRNLTQGIFIWVTGLPTSWSSPAAEAVLGRLDLFIIWNVLLLGIGFAAVFGVSQKRALLLAAGYRILIILSTLGLSVALGPRFL